MSGLDIVREYCGPRTTEEIQRIAEEEFGFKLSESGEYLRYFGGHPQDWLEAWKITLAKWMVLYDASLDYTITNSGSRNTCGLCMHSGVNNCTNCPIKLHTNEGGCLGTPYEGFSSNNHPPEKVEEELRFLLDLFVRQWSATAKS